MRRPLRLIARLIALVCVGSLTLGFRVFPGVWPVSKADPTLWVRLCASSLVINDDELPINDPLYGQSPTFLQFVQSVIDDFNSVPGAFVRLAMYPADPSNPGAPAAGDSVFTVARAEQRIIDICFDGTSAGSGLASGHAQPKYKSGELVACEIRGRSDAVETAQDLVRLLTHELGHCLGLDHNQASTQSVMSYFPSLGLIRLADDDKAGLTFLYPVSEDYGDETMTFGLGGCAPRD